MKAADNICTVGVALYSAPSLLNHSCRPNTLELFNGQHLILKAVRDIGPGDQLFIAYIDRLQLLSVRQTELRSKYNFTCACERCLEDISKSSVSDCWRTWCSIYHNLILFLYYYRDVLSNYS